MNERKCPKCDYVRKPLDKAPDYECPNCGVIYAKAEAAANLQKVKHVSAGSSQTARARDEPSAKEKIISEPGRSSVEHLFKKLDTSTQWLRKKEFEELPNVLWEDELAEQLIPGTYAGHAGLLVASNKRVIFIDKGFVRLRVEDFPYDKITSLQYKTGLLFGEISVYASGNKAEITNIAPKELVRPFAEFIRARLTSISQHASQPPNVQALANPTSGGVDVVSILERLGDLRAKGILTEDEFQVEKRKILGQ